MYFQPHHGVSRAYSRESDGGGSKQQDGAFDFTPKYMWSNAPGGGPKGVSEVQGPVFLN